MIGPVLLDNSAWARIAQPTLANERLNEFIAAVEHDAVHACAPFLLEAGYSARGAAHHSRLMERLDALPFAAIDREVERRALSAQAELARVGHHRIPPVDVLIAAIADRHGLGVLHYDADYDVIIERSALVFASVWIAPRGSL